MTAKQKSEMYQQAHDALVGTVVKLQDFAEDQSQFVDDLPTAEQQQASNDAEQLTGLVGKYAIKVKRLDVPA